MQRVSSYLKMRVLGAIESAPGESIVARIRHISEQVFVDEDGQRFRFTWRTIQTWYSRYKKDGTTIQVQSTMSMDKEMRYKDESGKWQTINTAEIDRVEPNTGAASENDIITNPTAPKTPAVKF